jgi:hypothetical protein
MQRTTKLMTIQDQLQKQGVTLVLVSLGTPLQAQKFIARTNFQGEMFVDPSSDGRVRTALSSQQAVAYNFFKLKRSVKVVRHPQVAALAHELDELGIGNWDDLMDSPETDEAGKTMEWAGDPFQVGGTFVLGSGNTCDYVYRSKYAGDHPPLAPLFEAATGKDMNGNDITPPATAAWAVTLGLNKKYKKKEEGEEKEEKDKDKDKDPTNTRAVKQQHQLDTDRANNNVNVWKIATAVAYGAVLVGTCTHLRTLIPFEIEYLQQTPVVRHWPEFMLSQLLLGCAAVLYTFFFTPTTQTTQTTTANDASNAPLAPLAPPVLAAPLPLDTTATPSLFLGDHAVEFLKVSDIDQMLERQGFMDGIINNEQLLSSMEMSTTPIVGISPVPQESSIVKAANPTCRARGDTWDATLGINEYAVILQYVRKFLAKTHHDIGRSGPVCPFVPKSLRKDALHLTVVRTGKGSATKKVKQDIEKYLKPFAEEFLKMEPTTGSARAFKAVIFIFPDITLDQTTACIDGVSVGWLGGRGRGWGWFKDDF